MAEDDMEERQEEKEEENALVKKEDYMHFRRQFDTIKSSHEGTQASSDKIKQQGNSYFSLGLYMQASMMYTEALELQPENPVLFCNRAMAYLKQDMPVEALADSEKSLELDASATNIKGYWRKAQALVDLNRHDEAEAAADDGLALQPGNQHLNRVRRVARETVTMRRLCKCDWVCKMPNGIEKRYKFSDNGVMTMTVFGHNVEAAFDLSVEGNPRSIVVKMKADGQPGPPPPPIPYIFEFHDNDEELWLCHPVNSTELPTKFEGQGFDRMRRGEAADCEVTFNEPLDDLCEKFIQEMNEVLPLTAPQLPAEPSEDEIGKEALIMDKIAKLKQKYGMAVHQRAMELTKDPDSAPSDALSSVAKQLRKRFVSRKILAEPKVVVPPEEARPAAPAVEAAPGNGSVSKALEKRDEAPSCLAGLVARFCGGSS
mmetsp:Transcript_102904/g.265994  ORF Transcript_102904/g.265994 Transcript_102904/m.265994 type:complete len:429 (+) Transcript_102904:46-1332(+)